MATIKVNNRSVPADQYLAGLRRAKREPAAIFKTGLSTWWPATGAEIMDSYRRDLHTRINERGSDRAQASRVHPATWAKASTRRVILERHDIRSLNRHARARLQHRQRDDA